MSEKIEIYAPLFNDLDPGSTFSLGAPVINDVIQIGVAGKETEKKRIAVEVSESEITITREDDGEIAIEVTREPSKPPINVLVNPVEEVVLEKTDREGVWAVKDSEVKIEKDEDGSDRKAQEGFEDFAKVVAHNAQYKQVQAKKAAEQEKALDQAA